MRYGSKHTEETKRKMSKAHKGQVTWNKGLTKETDLRMRAISEKLKGRFTGSDNSSWRGGVSFLPYSPEFNKPLRRSIRERDGKCLYPGCGITGNLTVHHIDYDKTNNGPDNLIALCGSHNSNVNKNKPYWEEYFKGLLVGRYDRP